MIKFEIEVHDAYGPGLPADAKYRVIGCDKPIWTNDIDEAVTYLRHSLHQAKRKDQAWPRD